MAQGKGQYQHPICSDRLTLEPRYFTSFSINTSADPHLELKKSQQIQASRELFWVCWDGVGEGVLHFDEFVSWVLGLDGFFD